MDTVYHNVNCQQILCIIMLSVNGYCVSYCYLSTDTVYYNVICQWILCIIILSVNGYCVSYCYLSMDFCTISILDKKEMVGK